MNIRRGYIVLVLLAATLAAAAKPPRTRTVVKTWQMPSFSAVADTIPFSQDTAMLNYFDIDIETRYSMSNAMNGNILVSPLESRIIQKRQYTIDDPFALCWTPYVVTPQQQRFFNTTTPYSSIAYKKGFTNGHEENDVSFLFTGNINRRLNLGVEMEYLNSAGHYAHTAGKIFRGSVWGSYSGAHYSMHGAFSWSKLRSFDNGGIQNVEDLGGKLNAEDIPVRMNVMTGYRYLSGFLHNQYAITKEREYIDSIEVVEEGKRVKRDTVKTEHIPLITFSHIFELNTSNRRYIEQDARQGFYEHTYFDTIRTNDTTDVMTIRNSLAVTFCEEYNTKLKFGASVFAMNEFQRFLYDSLCYDITKPYSYKWHNNTFVGGSIHKHSGTHVLYNVEGQVCVVGYKIGEFDIHGSIDTKFQLGGNNLEVSARAFVKSVKPSPYLQHFSSNHIQWENNFGFTYRVLGGATVAYPTKWFKPRIDFSFENRTNPIYVSASDWKPQQYNGSVQILTGDIVADLTTPWINLENHVVIQHTTNSDVLPVPLVLLQHRLYYHGSWFRRAMDAQIGVDLRYFTKYQAPVLCPATGMFATQQTVKIGNYPWMSVYANFYVRSIRLRFFAQYQHLNHLFMDKSTDYLAMPGYPTNRDVFRAGLAWHFYN